MSLAKLLAAGVLAIVGTSAIGQDYPRKPITLIVPAAPGGATSTTAFMLAERLKGPLKQSVVVDHKAGANGVIGTGFVAKSAPDGYTWLMASMSHIAINPSLYRDMGYDPVRDLMPVAMTSTFPLFLVVSPNLPVTSVRELVAYAKTKPDGLNYGSSGQGNSNHLAAELFNTQAGIRGVHVPYKGGGGLITATMVGEVSMTFGTPQTVVGQIKAGKLKVLAVSSAKRSSLYPDIPTIAESGLPNFAVDSWNGIFVPAGSPAPAMSRVAAEVVVLLKSPAVKAEMLKVGMEPAISTGAEFSGIVQSEFERWAKLIKDKKIAIEQ